MLEVNLLKAVLCRNKFNYDETLPENIGKWTFVGKKISKKKALTFEVFYQNFQCLKNLFHLNVTVKTLSYFERLLRQ